MKTVKNIQYLILIVSILLYSCVKSQKQNSKEIKPYDNTVVKIIKSKTYSQKKEFDKWVIDKPEDNISHRELEKDFDWTTTHLDKYSNIIYQENFIVDSMGNEKVKFKLSNKYFSPQEGKLSYSHEEYSNGVITEVEFIRNTNGDVIEIRSLTNKELSKKTIFKYNEFRQKINEDIYLKDGISEEHKYIYDNPSLKDGHIIKTISTYFYGRTKNIIEVDNEWNNKNQLIKSYRKYSKDGVLFDNEVTTYLGFQDNKSTLIVTKGHKTRDWVNSDTNEHTFKISPTNDTTKLSYSKYGDIIKYQDKYQTKNIEIVYNERNEWTNLILVETESPDFSKNRFLKEMNSPIERSYIVIREISYLKK